MSQKVRKLAIWHRPSANSRFLTRLYESEIANPYTYSGQKQSETWNFVWTFCNLRFVTRFYRSEIADTSILPNQKQSETLAGVTELCLNQTYGETFPRLNQTGEGFLRIFKDPWCRAGPAFTFKTDLWAPVRQARYVTQRLGTDKLEPVRLGASVVLQC